VLTQERIITSQPGKLAGAPIPAPAGIPVKRGETREIVKPISNSPGKANRAEWRSPLPGGPSPQALRLFFWSRRYQINAKDGILYKTVRTSSLSAEKMIISGGGAAGIAPGRKRTRYRIRGSIRFFRKSSF
jgi:hypothetical protein